MLEHKNFSFVSDGVHSVAVALVFASSLLGYVHCPAEASTNGREAVATSELVAAYPDIEALLDYRSPPVFSEVSVSADKRLLAIELQATANDVIDAGRLQRTKSGVPLLAQNSRIAIIDIAMSDASIVLGEEGKSFWGPSWSADGTKLAFYSDRDGMARLWIWDRSAATMHRVSDAIVWPSNPYHVPQWSRAGDLIMTRVLPEGLTPHEMESYVGRVASGQKHSRKFGGSVDVYVSDANQDASAMPFLDKPRLIAGLGIVNVATCQRRLNFDPPSTENAEVKLTHPGTCY